MQLALQSAQQVFDFLVVHEQVAVARDAELITAHDLHAGEYVVDVRVDDRRQKDELMRPVSKVLRDIDHARQRPRRLQDGDDTVPAEGVGPLQRNEEVETFVQDAGERMRRVEADGAQHGQQLAVEKPPHPGCLAGIPFATFEEVDALFGELRDQFFTEHPVLLGDQLMRQLADALELVSGGQLIRTGLRRIERDLLFQPGHADFEELVQVAR